MKESWKTRRKLACEPLERREMLSALAHNFGVNWQGPAQGLAAETYHPAILWAAPANSTETAAGLIGPSAPPISHFGTSTVSKITTTPKITIVAPPPTVVASGHAAPGSFTWSTTAGTITAGGPFSSPAIPSNVTFTAASSPRQGTAGQTVIAANFLGLKDPTLAGLVQSLDATGSISRNDMIQILRSVDTGNLSAADFADLQTIVADAAELNMPNYVQVLASDVVDGNPANAHYQGQPLGNLAAGSPASVLSDLIGKWFLGSDLPLADSGTSGNGDYSYALASGSLFVGNPSYNDEFQGAVGDCYLLSAFGSLADANPAAMRNMFLDNGDGTWTVRFYANGVADYVTVNAMLPVNSGGNLVYAGCGSPATSAGNVLWIPLAEKAYVEWDETGKEGRSGVNAYSDLESGWMSTVYTQLLGPTAGSFNLVTASDQAALVAAMTNHWAVSLCTVLSSNANNVSLGNGVYGGHAYAVIGYDSSAGTFTLYNPWGRDQPTSSLTWAQLQSVSDGFCVANPAGSMPIG